MEDSQVTGYELSRNWFNFCFENPELINPAHTAIYLFAIEHCNRLGWKRKFGFPSQMTMDALGIKKHQTYIKYFNDIVEWGGFVLIQKSQNQYSANIISISAMPENGKALDKAFINHAAKQTQSNGQSTRQSTDSIIKQLNKEQLTKKQLSELEEIIFKYSDKTEIINYQEILDNYSLYCEKLRKVTKLSDERKKHINGRFKEFDMQTIIDVIKMAGSSEFLSGKNERSWKADFDWIFNPTNFLKILEGKYSNKTAKNKLSV